jgi:hypothetical protein
MRLRRSAVVTALLVVPWLLAGQSRQALPEALTDQEFWSLTETFSEPNGSFRSGSGSPDNLLSNEGMVSTVAAQLAERIKPGGVYLGVGPEQNFSYIAAIKPRIAFITDIRRGNLHLHLMYKALFELSPDRAEFVSRLFTRARPSGLTGQSTAAELMSAFSTAVPGDVAAFKTNLKAVTDHLTKARHLRIDAEDLAGIEYVYSNFHLFGPGIFYTASIGGQQNSAATYAVLMSSTDLTSGAERTYLANEEHFSLIKAMQGRNLIVPIVGDFAGPKALGAIGTYLRERGVTVTAFYVSNVERYLRGSGTWQKFCANVASLPLDANSTFIRPARLGLGAFGTMAPETAGCR